MIWIPARNLDNERRYRNFLVAFETLPAPAVRAEIEARLPAQLRDDVQWRASSATLWCCTEEWPEGCDEDADWDALLAACGAWVDALPPSVFVFSGDDLPDRELARDALGPIVVPHLTALFAGGRIAADDLVLMDNLAFLIANRAVEARTPELDRAVIALGEAVLAAGSAVDPRHWNGLLEPLR